MKVANLRPGMLLKPSDGLDLILINENVFFRKEKIDRNVLTCRFMPSQNPYSSLAAFHGPVIYLGSKFDDFVYDGVYKHHRILAGDSIAVVSGYHFKDFCIAGEL